MKSRLRCSLLLAILGPAIVSAGPAREVPRSPAFAASLPFPAAFPPIQSFRLGTAGHPFGWTTIFGDFNGDGTPDLVIADRVGRTPGGFGYHLQVAVSDQGSRTVAFQSSYPALNVRAMDIDNDRDTDSSSLKRSLPDSSSACGLMTGVATLPSQAPTSSARRSLQSQRVRMVTALPNRTPASPRIGRATWLSRTRIACVLHWPALAACRPTPTRQSRG